MNDDEIYSPEASDTSRFGDWQSKLVFWLLWAPVIAIGAFGLWRLFTTSA